MDDLLYKKLIQCRKQHRYSLQYVADHCNVDLIEYMGWENGAKIPDFDHLKKLLDLYQISLEDFENMQLLEDDEMEKIIPYIDSVDNSLTMKTEYITEEMEQEYVEKTNVLKTISEEESNVMTVDDKNFLQKKFWLISIVLLLTILGMYIIYNVVMLYHKPKIIINLELTDSERLVANEDFIIMINKDGTLTGKGNLKEYQIAVDTWTDIVKLELGANNLVGLKKDGTLIALGDNKYNQLNCLNVKDVLDVEVGDNHIVLLNSNHEVQCFGDNSESQCTIDGITNVEMISAGENSSLAVLKDGQMKVFGKNNSNFSNANNIEKIRINNKNIVYLDNDGIIHCVGDKQMCIVDGKTKVSDFDMSTNHIGLLLNNGRIEAYGSNSEHQLEVNEFKNIVAIVCSKNNTIMLDRNNDFVGAGENKNSMYFEIEEEELISLATITNLKAEVINNQIVITWDKVNGAEYYALSVDELGNNIKIVDTKYIIDKDKLISGTDYTIRVKAASNQENTVASNEVVITCSYIIDEQIDNNDSVEQPIIEEEENNES